MNPLLSELLLWMQNNGYRRASFDRIIGIVPSAATYDQLELLIQSHQDIFRPACIKGGRPGLALQDGVNTVDELAKLYDYAEEEAAPMVATPPRAPVPSPSTTTTGRISSALVTAPRVTANDIELNIRSEFYVNGADAVGATYGGLRQLTLCLLVLNNDYVIVGKSSCVAPENYDVYVGRRLAREDAIRQMWPLLGFRLADKRTEF